MHPLVPLALIGVTITLPNWLFSGATLVGLLIGLVLGVLIGRTSR